MLRMDTRGGAAAGDEPERGAELRALRARAYGPDADIETDPAALRRLRELEARLHAPADPEPATAHRMTEAERTAPAPDPVAAPAVPVHAAPPSDVPPAGGPARETARTRPSARATLLWIASLVVVAVVAASTAWAVTRRAEADPAQVAVLGVNPDQRIPTVFGVEQDARRYADFHGLTVVALLGRGWLGGAPEDYCLLILDSSQVEWRTNSYTGEMYGGCGAGGFPATAQLRIVPGLPDELLARFPEGSALQFVLEGDEVVVLSDAGTGSRD